MSSCVIDASALLALLTGETASEQGLAPLRHAKLSAVSLAEAYAKCQRFGLVPAAIDLAILSLRIEVVPFDARQARVAGAIDEELSDLAPSWDRVASLALGSHLRLPPIPAENAMHSREPKVF